MRASQGAVANTGRLPVERRQRRRGITAPERVTVAAVKGTRRAICSALFVALGWGCSTPYIPDAGKVDDAPKADVETPHDAEQAPDAPSIDVSPMDAVIDGAEASVDALPLSDVADAATEDTRDATLGGSSDALADAGPDALADAGSDALADVRFDVLSDGATDVRPDAPSFDVSASDVAADVAIEVVAPPCVAGSAFIAAGSFMMGNDLLAFPRATPVHLVSLSAFCIDVTEVTAAAYAACVSERRCVSADSAAGCNGPVPARAMHPINCVDWAQARAYCQRHGGDLPTEAQWEFAARGPATRDYPWGDDATAAAAYACWSGGRASTCPVHAHPMGDTPTGVADLAGNVREWVLDWYAVAYPTTPVMDPTGVSTGTTRVRRGGSWEADTNPPRAVNAAYLGGSGAPTERLAQVGFRCVYPARR